MWAEFMHAHSMCREFLFEFLPVRIDRVEYFRRFVTADRNRHVLAVRRVKSPRIGDSPKIVIMRELSETPIRIGVNLDSFTNIFGVLILVKPIHEFITNAGLSTH